MEQISDPCRPIDTLIVTILLNKRSFSMKFRFTGFGLALVMIAASGCSQVIVRVEGTQPAPVIETQAAATEAPSTEAPAGKDSADSLPCPQDAEGMQFFADEANGYCVLVPEGFEISRASDTQ